MIEDRERLFANRLFAHLDAASRDELASKAVERRFQAGQLIVAEGALADCLFVVLSGSVQVFTERGTGTPIVLARLDAGEQFGEQALLPGRTGHRGASVRALTSVVLAEISAALLRRHLASAPQLESELLQLGDQQLRMRTRLKCEAIRFLDFGPDDLARLGSEDFAPGQLLMRQGDPSDKLFLVTSGELEVYEEKGARRRILHRLSAGQCVGELGLATGTPRSASVRAMTPVETVTISAAQFHELLGRSAGLRDHVKALQRCLSLREHSAGGASGFLTQYAGQLDGAECITTACRMDDGRHVVASLLVGSGSYHVDITRPGAKPLSQPRTLRHPAEGQAACELTVSGLASGAFQLESATATAEWPDVRQLHRLALDDTPWSEALIAVLLRDGRLPAPATAQAADDPNLLCGCMRVSYQQGLAAVLSGCADLAELGRATGCGTVCGGCKPRLLPLLGDSVCAPATLEEVIPLTPDVRAFRLQPRGAQTARHLAGQHVLVEGWIGGRWVRRSYTLSSAPKAGGAYEISVKREPRGVFSPWLFERKAGELGLRISEPRGEALRAPAAAPLVCLVAGIGVTPALALWRELAERGAAASGLLHYSARTAEQAAWLDELRAIAARVPGLQLVLRETARQGRLSRNDVRAIAEQFAGAEYFLCGPESYLEELRTSLSACGVAAERIRSERFSPAGAPPRRATQGADGWWTRLWRALSRGFRTSRK